MVRVVCQGGNGRGGAAQVIQDYRLPVPPKTTRSTARRCVPPCPFLILPLFLWAVASAFTPISTIRWVRSQLEEIRRFGCHLGHYGPIFPLFHPL